MLSCGTPQGERHITLYFQHYQSFDDARRQWFNRCQRVDFNKVYVIVEDGNNLTQNIINQYETIPIEHMVILCGNTELKGEHIVYMKGFKRKFFPGTSVKYRGIFGKRWIDEFDYIKYLSQ